LLVFQIYLLQFSSRNRGHRPALFCLRYEIVKDTRVKWGHTFLDFLIKNIPFVTWYVMLEIRSIYTTVSGL
jgi:hypothetical protein